MPGLEAAGADDAAKLRAIFAVKDGDPVIAEDVIAAGVALTTALGEEGFAEAKLGEQDITVNHETHLATLVLPVTPGPIAQFGAIRVTGKPPFDSKHVGVIARFKAGDRFRRSRVDDLRRALLNTGLIANATLTVVPRDGGRIADVDVALEPAPSRTIAGELGYGTGAGARLEASWTDRNFFNPEGALTLRGVAGTSEQLAAVQFRRSNFRMRDQTLNLQALASHTNYDAYEAKTVKLAGGIERQSNFIWQKKWTWTAGAELLATDEQGAYDISGIKQTRTFLIAALPASLGYDGSDSLLDPSRGFRLSGSLSPEISAHGGSFTYARTQIDASAYHPVSDRVVVAGRMRLGTIIGADVFNVAPSRRFYSGGGGSVRGYGYQRLGPKDVDGDPTGGRGLAEVALEARIRLSQFGGNFGIVPFVDAGTLTDNAIARFRRLQIRGRPGRALLLELRPDPHRRRRSAQPREGRRPGRGRGVARPGVLARDRHRHHRKADGRSPARRRPPRLGDRGCSTNWLALFIALLVAARGRVGPARHRARAPLRRRSHRAARNQLGPQDPHRADRGVVVRQVGAAQCRGVRPARSVPEIAAGSRSTGPRRRGCRTACRSTA